MSCGKSVSLPMSCQKSCSILVSTAFFFVCGVICCLIIMNFILVQNGDQSMHQRPLPKKLVLRLSFLALITSFCLTLLMAGTPLSIVHAAPCVVRGAFTNVYDSYHHDQGVLSVHRNYCNNTVWATFLSNTNTWTSVQVGTILYPNTGNTQTLYSQWYGWKANTNFNAPAAGARCVAASITMYDNRYQEIQSSTGTSWC